MFKVELNFEYAQGSTHAALDIIKNGDYNYRIPLLSVKGKNTELCRKYAEIKCRELSSTLMKMSRNWSDSSLRQHVKIELKDIGQGDNDSDKLLIPDGYELVNSTTKYIYCDLNASAPRALRFALRFCEHQNENGRKYEYSRILFDSAYDPAWVFKKLSKGIVVAVEKLTKVMRDVTLFECELCLVHQEDLNP